MCSFIHVALCLMFSAAYHTSTDLLAAVCVFVCFVCFLCDCRVVASLSSVKDSDDTGAASRSISSPSITSPAAAAATAAVSTAHDDKPASAASIAERSSPPVTEAQESSATENATVAASSIAEETSMPITATAVEPVDPADADTNNKSADAVEQITEPSDAAVADAATDDVAAPELAAGAVEGDTVPVVGYSNSVATGDDNKSALPTSTGMSDSPLAGDQEANAAVNKQTSVSSPADAAVAVESSTGAPDDADAVGEEEPTLI